MSELNARILPDRAELDSLASQRTEVNLSVRVFCKNASAFRADLHLGYRTLIRVLKPLADPHTGIQHYGLLGRFKRGGPEIRP